MSILSNLSEEEKEQAKQYADAIKETKKALFELINKAKSRGTQNEGDRKNWGGPRKNLVMPVNEKKKK